MKLEIEVPETLNEITLRQYQKFLKFLKLENKKEAEIKLATVNIFCNVNEVVVRSMKASDINEICEHITNLLEQTPSLINRFKLNGVNYGFINNLDSISFGEYVDLDTYIGDWDNMQLAMNVLYRPIVIDKKERYLLEDYNPNESERVLDMPLSAVISSIIFFYNLGIELSQAIMNSSRKENEKILAEHLNLEQNGVGIAQFMDSLKGILQDLKISQN